MSWPTFQVKKVHSISLLNFTPTFKVTLSNNSLIFFCLMHTFMSLLSSINCIVSYSTFVCQKKTKPNCLILIARFIKFDAVYKQNFSSLIVVFLKSASWFTFRINFFKMSSLNSHTFLCLNHVINLSSVPSKTIEFKGSVLITRLSFKVVNKKIAWKQFTVVIVEKK